MSDGKTRERELTGIITAAKVSRAKQLTIITIAELDTIRRDGVEINIRPIQEWLL